MSGIIKKTISVVLIAWAALVVIFCIVVPRFQKKAEPSQLELPGVFADGAAPERVLCIDDNQEALLRRLQVIESAEKEILLSSYYYGDDDSAHDITAALLEAADRGVDIRILVDGFCAFTALNNSPEFKTLASDPHVEVRIYNPVNVVLPVRINYRMHDKYLVADDSLYILGGRNTRNVSLGDYSDKKDMDRDLLVYCSNPVPGNSVFQVKAYFESVWALDTNKPYTRTTKKAGEIRESFRSRWEKLRETRPEVFEIVNWESVTMPTAGVTLLHNPIEAADKAPTLWADLTAIMDRGQEILIQTPYLICNHRMYEDLRDLHRQGSDVRVITNAPECGANPNGCADYLNQRHKIRATGMKIYEYAGPHSAHSKTVLVDDHISVVGSFNFDMRSAYLDTELMLVVDSPELNAHLRQLDGQYMSMSRCILPDGTKILGENFVKPHMPILKYVLYGVLRLVTIPIRHLL